MNTKVKRDKPMTFHCTPAMHAALMELARREGESASMILRRLTSQALAEAQDGRPVLRVGAMT